MSSERCAVCGRLRLSVVHKEGDHFMHAFVPAQPTQSGECAMPKCVLPPGHTGKCTTQRVGMMCWAAGCYYDTRQNGTSHKLCEACAPLPAVEPDGERLEDDTLRLLLKDLRACTEDVAFRLLRRYVP